MKPNFALSLSIDGIRLLHRTGSGPTSVWTMVGEVAIDAPDLASQLAVLRKTGLALDPQGLRTKLLIPNDQIKYLALDTTRADEDAVRAALDGTTPYPVADLQIDFVRGGGRTYIAAVARETLAEAEAFAAEHRFGPVSFAGVPATFTYVGEAFFGPTSMAARLLGAGQQVERDDQPVLWHPKVRQPDVPVRPMPAAPVSVQSTDTVVAAIALARGDLAGLAPKPGLAQNTRPDPVEPDTDLDGASVELPKPHIDPLPVATSLSDALAVSDLAEPNLADPDLAGQLIDDAPFIEVPAAPDMDIADFELVTELAPEPEPTPKDEPGPATPPDGILAVVAVPAAPDVEDPAGTDADIAVSSTPAPARSSLVPDPVFASRGRTLRADPTDVPAMRQPLSVPPGSRTTGSRTTGSHVPGNVDPAEPMFSRRTEPPVARPAAMPVPQPVAAAFVPVPDAGPYPVQVALAAQTATAARNAVTAPQLAGAKRQPGYLAPGDPAPRAFNANFPTPAPQATAPAVTGQSGAARPAEAVAALVVSFRPAPEPTNLTAVAPVSTPVAIQTVTLTPVQPTLAKPGVTAPTADFGKPPPFASGHGRVAPKLQIAPEPTPSQAFDTGQPQRAKVGRVRTAGRGRPRYLGLILTLLLLAGLAAVAAWASSLSPDGLAGLFGRTTPTDVAEVDVGPSPLNGSDLTATTLSPPADSTGLTATATLPVLDVAPTVTAVPGLATPDSATDATVAILPDIAPASPDLPVATPTATATGTVVSPAEADRIYAATGVWLRAPRLPLIPTADPVGTLTVAGLDSGVVAVAQPVLPALAGASPDQALLTPVDPPAPGTVFQRDARGFVLATPEGTLTPDGILVFAGSPEIIPPNRPGSAVAAPVAVAPAAPRIIAATAPPLAPRPLTPAPDETSVIAPSAGGVGLGSLGPVVRPLLRPETAAAATVEPAEPQVPAPVLAAYPGPAPQLRPLSLTPQTAAFGAAVPVVPPDTNLAIEDTVAAILAAGPPDPVISDSRLAVANARIPQARPQNFADVVASAQQRSAPAAPQNPSLAVIDPPPEPPPEPPAAPAPAAVEPDVQTALLPESAIVDEIVAPTGPIPGGVATNATLDQAIDLREVNLIGVFGRPNDRRALVRLANGRFVRVGVGDSLDGGQVAAIGDNALNYVKRGQTITIAIPNG